MSNYQTLKGFRDFVGNDARKRGWLISVITSVFERFGFEPLESPALEYAELLTGKYGEEAEKLIYSFEDRGERKVALRYDQTVPTARIISQYRNDIAFPYKRYQIQPVWRADKPQKGRYREFLQCDADIIGSTSELADAEIIALYYAIYLEIGFDTFSIALNDRTSLISVIKDAGIKDDLIPATTQILDKAGKITEDEMIAELEERGVTRAQTKEVLKKLAESEPSENLKAIMLKAIMLGVPENALKYDPMLVRGLDYYTGLIFEGKVPEYTVGSVGGGGRYDKLINDLVGFDAPAVGFGLGFDRTLEAAEELNLIPDMQTTEVYVTIFSTEYELASIETANQLRSCGFNTEIAMDDMKFDKQLKYANKKAIPFVVIIGPDEANDNVVTVKNMETGDQKSCSIAEAILLLSGSIDKEESCCGGGCCDEDCSDVGDACK